MHFMVYALLHPKFKFMAFKVFYQMLIQKIEIAVLFLFTKPKNIKIVCSKVEIKYIY